MVQVNSFDQAGRPGKEVLERSITQLDDSLAAVYGTVCNITSGSATATDSSDSVPATAPAVSRPTQLPYVPPELIQYVDNGRNPDIYTREFVELARKGNQLLKGKMEAFADFRDILAGEMCRVLPELETDVALVLDQTKPGNIRG
ncbi:Bgt-4196 [Blumeria graminis f. sp. tritici]|uniref:Mediator of RNA polymerase II transcription subunit 10 n=3 Tax=Blumeria graminis f. sp. tritici TaxID=62690 RepID=A0A656KKK8_BLUGR|nr:Subunit of the RNA polymerase II mediator complex [Blumeria graminis f. sp. tritici 96224]VCU41071.1 Bgt-4196 [Blumeria graminis f. sp. tritici]